MDYPLRYKTLVEYMIDYRNNKNGYFTTIYLNQVDFAKMRLDKDIVLEMLKETIKDDGVRITDPDDKKKKVVINIINGDVYESNETIVIKQCDKDALEPYLEKIKKDLKMSQVIVDINNWRAKMPDMIKWLQFNKAAPFEVLRVLHQSFPEIVKYEDIFNRIIGSPYVKFKPKIMQQPEERRSPIQEIVRLLRKRMLIHGFSNNIIETYSDDGYRLSE